MRPHDSSGLAPSRDAIALSALLIVAFVVRWIAWQRTAVLFNDGPIFLAMADAIGQGHWGQVLSHPYHPLYPALIRLVAAGPVGLETAGVLVSILGGLLSVIAIFLFTRFAFDREIAWLSAWIVALHPWAVDFSADVMSDGLYAGLYLLGFAAMARTVMKPGLRSGAACGLAAGLAYLVRPEGIGLLMIGGLLLAIRAIVEPPLRRRLLLGALALGLVGTIVASPLVLEASRRAGGLVLTQKKSLTNLMLGSSDEKARPPSSPAIHPSGASRPTPSALPMPASAIRAEGRGEHKPTHDFSGLLEAVWRMLSTSLAAMRYELLPFALLGLWAMRGQRDRWREASIGLPILLYSVVLTILVWGAGYVSRRHALAAWLPAVGFVAVGWRFACRKLTGWARAQGFSRWVRLETPGQILLALVVTLCLVWGMRDLRPRRQDRVPVRAAGEWLARNHPDSGAVAAQKLRTAYYAREPFVPLPPGLNGRLERDLVRRGARWVVIDGGELGDHLGLEDGIGRWLRPVHEIPSSPAPILILAIEPEPAH